MLLVHVGSGIVGVMDVDIDRVVCEDDLEEIAELVKKITVDDKIAELASRKGVTVVVEKYLRDGNDANKILPSMESGFNVKTCLLANGVSGGYLDVAKLVLQYGGGASLKFEDRFVRTCLQRALIEENDEMVDLLLEYGDWEDDLTAAVYRGDGEKGDHLQPQQGLE